MNELNLAKMVIDERYQIVGRISAGSYAEVFVARDLQDAGCEVVIKALNANLQGTVDLDLESTLVENFEKEAAILESVSHPNIIAILDNGNAVDADGRDFRFMALEYMQGGDLLRYTREQMNSCLSLGHALTYFGQICAGLTHAHENGIIHRDLKPNNFLLGPDHQSVKIADFGVAKLTSVEPGEITQVGTGVFSAPEHSPTSPGSTFGKLTVTADIYSLAKSFFAIVCGRTPTEFAGKPVTDLPPAASQQA
jgi:serine/threonine protein kinase